MDCVDSMSFCEQKKTKGLESQIMVCTDSMHCTDSVDRTDGMHCANNLMVSPSSAPLP